MQRVTPDKGSAFRPVEQAPREVFIPSLLHGLGEGTPVRLFTRLLVKQSTLALLDPNKTVPENWTVPCFITGRLVTALRNHKEFMMADHSAYIQEGRMGCGIRVSCRQKRPCQRPWRVPMSKTHAACNERRRRVMDYGASINSKGDGTGC